MAEPSVLDRARMAMQEPYPSLLDIPSLLPQALRYSPAALGANSLQTMSEAAPPVTLDGVSDFVFGQPPLVRGADAALEYFGLESPMLQDFEQFRQEHLFDPGKRLLQGAGQYILGIGGPGPGEEMFGPPMPPGHLEQLQAQAIAEAEGRLAQQFNPTAMDSQAAALAQARGLLQEMPMTTKSTFSQPAIDYAAGFPQQAPQMEVPDYTAADAAIEASAPEAPEETSWQDKLLPLLAGAAQGAMRGNTTSEILAGAGAGSLFGLMDQRQREQELDARFQEARRHYEMSKAQIMAGRAEQAAEREAANNLSLYNHNIGLHELQIETLKGMQTRVDPFAGGMAVTSFNPNTRQMETSVIQENSMRKLLARETIKAALGTSGSKSKEETILDFGTMELDPSEFPYSTQPALMAAMSIHRGTTPDELLEIYGIDYQAMRQAAREELNAQGLTGTSLQEESDMLVFNRLMEQLIMRPDIVEQLLPPQLGGLGG